jgi:hypothetical protein
MFASTLRRALGVSAALALAVSFGPAAHAQDKMSSGAKKPAPAPTKMESKITGPVYVCKMCKTVMTPAEAKKAGYKDPMGHKMVKMDKAPAGYTHASMMDSHMPQCIRPTIGIGAGFSCALSLVCPFRSWASSAA